MESIAAACSSSYRSTLARGLGNLQLSSCIFPATPYTLSPICASYLEWPDDAEQLQHFTQALLVQFQFLCCHRVTGALSGKGRWGQAPAWKGGLVADIHGLLRDVPYLVEYASHKEVEVVLLDSNISLTCSTAGALCAKWVGPIPDPVVPRKLQHAVERVARALCPGAGDAAPSTFEWELTTICPLKRLFYSHYASPLFEDEYWMANEKEAPTRTDIKILRNATEVAIHPFEGLPLHVWHCLDLKKEAELNQSRSKSKMRKYLGVVKWSKHVDAKRRTAYSYSVTSSSIEDIIALRGVVTRWLTDVYQTEACLEKQMEAEQRKFLKPRSRRQKKG